MIIVSIFVLLANVICLYLLQKSKSKEEIHMKASLIFTSNDVIINLGVVLAGVLVNWLNWSTPDLVIGSIVLALVVQGALRILKLAEWIKRIWLLGQMIGKIVIGIRFGCIGMYVLFSLFLAA